MQQFVVPQFIDVEGKIIGPITTRQFVIMLAGGGIIFLSFRFGDFTFFLATTVLVSFFVVLFAFIKVNSRPFHLFLINFLQTLFMRKMLRVWQREEFTVSLSSKITKGKGKKEKEEVLSSRKKTVARTQLSELALIVDTGGVYKAEEETPFGII